MPARNPGRKRLSRRAVLRGIRIALLLLVFLLVAAAAYLDEIGLPDFLKRPLLAKLRERGVELQFTRLRLRWHRGFVAENVKFGGARDEPGAPQLSVKEAELKLNRSALARFNLNVDSVVFHDGQIVWTLDEPGQPPVRLAATNIETRLRLSRKDEWNVEHFTAYFAGTKLRLSGSITNASALRDWEIFRRKPGAPPDLARKRLRDLAETIEKIKFTGTPQVSVILNGDARDPKSFHGAVTLNAPAADTPWGTTSNSILTANLLAPNAQTNQPQVDIKLRVDEASTPWAGIKGLQLALHVQSDETLTNPVSARLLISMDRIETRLGEAGAGNFQAQWTHSLTNPVPLEGTGTLRLSNFTTSVGKAGAVVLTARLSAPASAGPRQANEQWAWWAPMEPYPLDLDFQLTDIEAEDARGERFELKELAFGGLWRAPNLNVTNIHAELYGGRVDAHAVINIATRTAEFGSTSDFDAQKIAPLLTEAGQRWMRQFSWEKPPLAQGTGSVILPAWTNHAPDWRGEVLPTLTLRGEFKAGKAAFRGVPVTSAHSHFTFSNQVWELPDIVATRPEGNVELAHRSNERTKEYYFRVRSGMDILAVRNLLPPEGQRGLDLFKFTQPPVIDAEIWGRWKHPGETGMKGHVTMDNFTFRGESASHVHGDIQYTNKFMLLTAARLENAATYMTAEAMGFDFESRKAFLTNGFSTMDPAPFTRAIGRKVAQTMEPYQFLKPPTVRAHGTIPLDNEADADLHFQVDGGPFKWTKFNLDHVTAGVDWVGDSVRLTNVTASAYGGQLAGDAAFDFNTNREAIFSFNLNATNANLQSLMTDVSTGTNHLEGRLSGTLRITQGNSHDFWSWNGNGNVTLEDGLIWEIPIFGIFTPVLDALSPGLGRSRASDGAGTFTITNSIIRSDDLQIRSRAVSLMYDGIVTFDGRVDAVVEAKLLRETPLLGPVLSTALMPLTKLFEYEVSGTLSEPKSQPLFIISKILLMPLSPIQTLRGLLPGETPGTYSPPIRKDRP